MVEDEADVDVAERIPGDVKFLKSIVQPTEQHFKNIFELLQ